jgi:arabinogalactan endo-1,4-beta-galactosidase
MPRQKSSKSAKTKDLINLLLSHGARAWRYSQPEVSIHLHVTNADGRAPVTMRLR